MYNDQNMNNNDMNSNQGMNNNMNMNNDQGMNNNMNMNNNQGMNMNTNYNGQQYNNMPQNNNNNNNNKSGSKTIFIIIAVVVALVVFGIFILNKKDNNLDGNQNGTNNNGSSSIDNNTNNNNQGNNNSSNDNTNNGGSGDASSSIVEYGNSGKIDSVGLELKMLDKAYVRENYDRYKHLSIYQLFSVKNNSDKPLLIGTVYSTDSAELQEVSSSKNKLTNYSTYVSYKTPSGEKKTQDCGFFSKGGGFDSPAISETAYIIKPGETKNAYISCTIENWKDSLGTFDNISGYVVGDMFDKEAIGFRAPTGYSSMVELNKGE